MSALDNKPNQYLKNSFGLNFRIGLIVAMGLCIMAFKIAVPYGEENTTPDLNIGEEPLTIEVAPPRTKTNTPPPPQKVVAPKPPIIIFNPVPAPEPVPDPIVEPIMPPEPVIDEPGVTYFIAPKEPVTWAEEMPEFIGSLPEYLKATPYCEWAKEVDIEGTVGATFVIDENGNVTDVRIDKKLFPCLDEAVKAHLQNMPKWKPGKMQGHPVKVRMGVPIKFNLN